MAGVKVEDPLTGSGVHTECTYMCVGWGVYKLYLAVNSACKYDLLETVYLDTCIIQCYQCCVLGSCQRFVQGVFPGGGMERGNEWDIPRGMVA